MRTQACSRRAIASKRLIGFVGVAALIAIMLPTAITHRAGGLLQVLSPFQDAATRVADDATALITGDDNNARQDSSTDVTALQRAVASLTAQNAHLRHEVDQLTGLRNRSLGATGRLIPTRAIADDASVWRRSKLILGGIRRGVNNADAVITRMDIDATTDNGTRNGLAVLAGESLVGVIEHAGTFTSRVRLLSDPATRIPVAVGRTKDDAFVGPDAVFWLLGRGENRIEMRDIHHRYVDDGTIRVGDIVLTLPDDPELPPSLVIGSISRIYPDPDNALLYIFEVDTGLDLAAVRRLYVVDRDG